MTGQDRLAVVTASASGIGLVTAKTLARDGWRLVLSDAEDGVHFYLPTGALVTEFTLPGLSLARRPLASWRGAVVAIVAARAFG